MDRQDVVIAGAGLVGATLACGLAQAGFQVMLLDPQDPQGLIEKDQRTSAISYGSMLFLNNLGIWDRLEHSPSPIRTIRVTQAGRQQALVYDHATTGYEALGFMVGNRDLRRAIWETVQEGVDCRIPDQVHASTPYPGHIQIDTHQEPLKASLLVGAEGHHSPLRQKIQYKNLKHDYQQTALVFTLAHTEDHQQTAFEHFTPDGPLAFLPLYDKKMAGVWSLKTVLAKELASTPEILLHALIHHFGWGLGTLSLVSEIQAYPLRFLLPLKPWDDRLLLIGDAAHVFHPVVGQGVNVGFRDAQTLVDHLIQARALGLDLGESSSLHRWVQMRRKDQWSMGALTHGLVRAFQIGGPLKYGCALGFWGLSHLAPLRARLTRHAMGL